MKAKTTKGFWQSYVRLPVNVQRRAAKVYLLWKENPHHPSLQFKRVSEAVPLYSARVSDNYRVLDILDQDTLVWYWIGAHDEYERMLR